MSGEWKPIVHGFLIALAGAGAMMLLIVGISAGYVGKSTISIVSLAVALCLAVAFRIYLTPFLDALDKREADFARDVAAERLDEAQPPVA